MKSNATKLGAAIAAVCMANAAPTFAYDSGTMSGGVAKEIHSTQQITGTNSTGGTCQNSCVTFGGDNTEVQSTWSIDNVSPAPGNPVIDTSTGSGPTAAFIHVGHVYLPGPNVNDPSSSGTNYHSHELTSRIDGKIIGGWIRVTTGFNGATFYGLQDYDDRSSNVYSGCASQPSADQIRSMNDGGASTPVAGCVLDTTADLFYLSCDSQTGCGELGKAVPIPAFAAATLALGLAGITYLTSRRRTVK
ncbi:MAG: hypothetical protein EX270_01270 [Pseudomonadales bacterium]|nr:MAG: hypothetical protein EX270_01270 [Pseudomonadales bacterium]